MADIKDRSKTDLLIGPARMSYAHVHTARAVNEGDDPAYSVTFLLPKENTKMCDAVYAAEKAAIEAGKLSKWGGKIPPKLKSCIHDGDEDRPDDPNYKGMLYISTRNKRKPEIMVRVDGRNVPLINESDFYSGCYGWGSVNFFPYSNKSNGVGCSLQNLLKTKDGEKLASGRSAEEDFASFMEDDDMM